MKDGTIQFNKDLANITPTETEVMTLPPVELIPLIEAVMLLFKQKIRDNRLVLGRDDWQTHQKWLRVRFEEWSRSFCKVLQLRINQVDPGVSNETSILFQQLHGLFLFHSKCREHLYLVNSDNVFTSVKGLGESLNGIVAAKLVIHSIDLNDALTDKHKESNGY